MAIIPTQASSPAPLLGSKSLVSGTANKMAKASASLADTATKMRATQMGGGQVLDLNNAAADSGELDDLIKQATATQQSAQNQDLAQLQQQSGQDTKFTQQKADLAQKSTQAKQAFANQTDELLQKFEQQQDLLGLDRYKSETEQLLFGMRMQNNKYIDKLKNEAARARLTDAASFREAMAATTFSDELGLLKGDLEFQKLLFGDNLNKQGMLNDDTRAFERQVGMMDLEMALKLALADNEARSEALRYESIGSMLKAAGKAGTEMYRQSQADAKKAQEEEAARALQTGGLSYR